MSSRVREPLVDVTGARKRRAQARLRLRMTVAGVLLGVLALFGGGAWLMGYSTVFSADEITTSGLTTLTHDEVVATAAVPLGGPLARVDTGEVADRVATLPAVASVTVSQRFPHTVAVDVTERTPLLVVAKGSEFTWVDEHGVAFHTGTDRPDGVLEAKGGSGNEELLTAYAAVAQALPPGVREQVAAIKGYTLDSITLELTDGRTVVWGSPEASELKGEVLGPLLSVKARVYDVSAPTNPTTR